jgi:hypothetical protein
LTSDKGAVTAEFMLLLPALLVLLASGLGLFQVGLDRIALEVQGFEVARAVAIGLGPEIPDGHEMTTFSEGRLTCVLLTQESFPNLETKRCMIPYGG